VPGVVRRIIWVVSPLLQRLPVPTEDISVVLPPLQKASAPPANMVGVGGVLQFTDVIRRME
jgi:hypothetical protein